MPPAKILIIEDDRALADLLAANLEREGYKLSVAVDGRNGLRRVHATPPDLIVLDLILPHLPGLEACWSLRASAGTRDIPVVMVAVKAEEHDELVGFAMGADEYVTKPFRIKVLIERIKRLIDRRRAQQESPSGMGSESRGLVIDGYRLRAMYRGQELQLTPLEYRLLEAMPRQPGRAFSRHELIEVGLGDETVVLDRTIDVHVERLRKKLGEAADLIEAVPGNWLSLSGAACRGAVRRRLV
jgi:two-component system phosphate regulon response regulator PhoB